MESNSDIIKEETGKYYMDKGEVLLNQKNYVVLITILLTGFFAFTSAVLADSPTVVVNGQPLVLEAAPLLEEDHTLVPLRAIFEALSASVDWDDSTQTVTATTTSDQLKLTIGSSTAYKNGSPLTLAVPARIVGDGYTMVPLRFISEALGASVEWDAATQTATINSLSNTGSSTGGLVEPSGSWLEAVDPEAMYENAITYIKDEQYEKAIEAFSRCIEMAPDISPSLLSGSYFSRGQLYDWLGISYTQAISDYSKAIEINPGVAVFHDYRGYTLSLLGRCPEALQDYQQARSLGYIPRQLEYPNDKKVKASAMVGVDLYKKYGSTLNDPKLNQYLQCMLPPVTSDNASPFKKIWTYYDQTNNTAYAGLFLDGSNFEAYTLGGFNLEEVFASTINELRQYYPRAKVYGWVQLEEEIADPMNHPALAVDASYRQIEGNTWLMEFTINYFGENEYGNLGIYTEGVG